MTCHRVPMSPSLCTCGVVLDITQWHGDDELGNPLCPTCSGCGCEPNERNERVSVPTDTPSTDGAPDPEEVIAHRFSVLPYMSGEDKKSSGNILVVVCDCGWIGMTDNEVLGMGWDAATLYRDHIAGLRVVPEDRPAPCPTCDAPPPDHYQPRWGRCDDPWHAPAGVPALDDDTRREVEALIERVKGRSVSYEAGRHYGIDLSLNHLDVSLMERMADLLAAAYLGGTDGR